MIKAVISGPKGPVYLFGLSDKNVELLTQDREILINFAEIGGPPGSHVIIMHGKTEAAIAERLNKEGINTFEKLQYVPDASPGIDEGERYPHGKLNEHDEGAMQMQLRLGREGNSVVMDFGKPVKWIGFDADSLRRVIAGLQAQLANLEENLETTPVLELKPA